MTTSTIPTPATPDVATITVLIDGTAIAGEFNVQSAVVRHELGRIPAASIQLLDGEASRQTFAASDTDHFTPGREVEIQLGYRGENASVFKGVVVRHSVRVRKSGSLLLLECRDEAVRMTRGRRSRYFTDTSDSDVIEEILQGHGLARSVTATSLRHRELVQYDASDWDFVVCRAEANGHVVIVRDGTLTIAPPSVSSSPVVSVGFGATLLELDAEVDARWQVTGVDAASWDTGDQAVVKVAAAEPEVTASGNLSATDLAQVLGGEQVRLQHGGALAEPELQAWADGQLLRNRLAKVRGRARFQGFGEVHPGEVIDVTGIGQRFAGGQYVSGVRHTYGAGNWETDVTFGLAPEQHATSYAVSAPAAGALLPSAGGLQVGVVTALQDDPEGEHRIRVRIPLVSDADDGAWARLATLDAGSDRGTFFRPEIGDEVVVGFLAGDPRHPVVLGQLHSSAKPAPVPGSDDNHEKGYVSRSGIKLTFDDDKTVVALETPAGTSLVLSDEAGSAVLTDKNGNSITLDSGGITITSAKDLTFKAAGDVAVNGNNLKAAAQIGLAVSAQTNAEVTSSGVLTLKGSLVRIN